MKQYCIYKLKEGKSLNQAQEMFSSENYVYVEGFAKNPLCNKEEIYAVYSYVDIDTLDYTNQILFKNMLPYQTFKEYFELYWDVSDINAKISELAEEKTIKEDSYESK